MRVGVVAEQLRQAVPGGIGTYASGLLGGLRTIREPDLDVVALAGRVRPPDPLDDLADSVATWPLPHRALVALWDRGLARPRGSFDVVHLCSFAGPLPTGKGPPTTVMVHDLAWRSNPELTTTRGARWHEAAYLRARHSSASIITPSRATAELVLADGVSPDRVTVIAEGCDHLPPSDEQAADTLLMAHGIEGAFLLTVSTLEPRKNLARLVEARRRLGPDTPPLLVVGPAGWGPAQKPADGVVLLGRQPGEVLAALYGRCEVFAYVPLLEGFGLPPLEAMAHGAAVLVSATTPSTSAADIACQVDPSDTTAIADGLEWLLSVPPERQALADAGRAFAGQHRWSDVARQHLELWRSIS